MLRIRLSRVGKKKQPSYRIVVADSRAPRDGAFVEIIGHYNPLTEPASLVVKEERARHWLERGAQPSDTAAQLLARLGLLEKVGLAPPPGPQVPPKAKPRAKAAAKKVEAPATAPAEAEEGEAAEAEPSHAEAVETETPQETE